MIQPSEIERARPPRRRRPRPRLLALPRAPRSPSEAGRDRERQRKRDPPRPRPPSRRWPAMSAPPAIAAPASAAASRRRRRRARSAAARPRCAAGGGAKPRRAAPPRIQNTSRMPLAVQRPMAGEPPAPDRDRQHQRDRCDAEQLHQQVGDDGAGNAEQVAHRRVGGVAERGSCTDQVASAATSRIASAISASAGELAQARGAAPRARVGERGSSARGRGRWPTCPSSAQHRDQAMQRLGRGLRSCTMATRM